MIDAVEKIKSTYENKNTQSAYLNMLRKIQNEFGDIFESINYNTEQINEREWTNSKFSEKVWEKY